MRDLEKDLAICEAATKGPWRWSRNEWLGGYSCLTTPDPCGGPSIEVLVATWDEDGATIEVSDENRNFIGEAREGWPEAIKRAKAAEAEVTRLREALEFYADREVWMKHTHIRADGTVYDAEPVLIDAGASARAALKAGDPA